MREIDLMSQENNRRFNNGILHAQGWSFQLLQAKKRELEGQITRYQETLTHIANQIALGG